MVKVAFIIFGLLLSAVDLLFAQDVVWTGNAGNNDFFDELNWKDQSTGMAPENGTIDPGVDINLQLGIVGVETAIQASAVIKFGTGRLSVQQAILSANAIEGGKITIRDEAYLDLADDLPLPGNTAVEFVSPVAWLRLLNVPTTEVLNNYIALFSVGALSAQYPDNIRIDNYYLAGSVVRMEDAAAKSLTIFSDPSYKGTSEMLALNTVHSGASIPGGMDNAVSSLVLKKGYMLTCANNKDGTGLSKVYIASEADLEISNLPGHLDNQISFMRVVIWNWVAKKGIGGQLTGLNETWYYAWNNNGNSTIEREYAPMSWGKGGADEDSDIEIYKSKYKATHVLAFNESDNCNDQSGQWGNLCETEVAVETYRNLMKTGLRLVSPSCRENAPFGWLKEFYEKATDRDIRIDVIGVHWYDWGSNPKNSPNADPQKVFNRFKNYLQRVHDLYGLPIWITEFNANPNRTAEVNFEFMQLALPYLEELEYVERYAWFQPNSGVADFYDSQENYTSVGEFYKGFEATPSVKEATIMAPSNLDEKIISGISESTYPDEKAERIFPNPSSRTLNIPRCPEGEQIEIYSMHGVLVANAAYHSDFDVSELKPGMYFVKTDRQCLKFVKK